ncbi:hypothetical protein [Clostridium ljungdahlii]|uniref:Spore coat protein n=1 Tax=Clostridium ljungdahlii TaxID=1538 RepID=A0A168NN52_9CLOT|nr:hypothetical protein [Clostridium ljungdahlii]OAA86673.1 hypothetical protein WY13_02061 [Clostridium ljungdahlii]
MYFEDVESCFVNYLESKKIFKVKEFDNTIKYKNISLDNIKEQLFIISEFHRRTLKYSGIMNKRLYNNIGKEVEQYKVYTKKLKKYLDRVGKLQNKTIFQEKLNQIGKKYLIRAESCMHNLDKNGYTDLIIRSMKRVEMCLTNTYFNNLRKKRNIEVIDIEGCCYNMVEMDAVYFLNRIKRKGINADFYEIIMEFCKYEHLKSSSVQFILSMISYPNEVMKCCSKYIYGTKNWTEEEYVLKLNKAMSEDGESLIKF